MGNPIVFILLAIIALAAALGMLFSRNAVHSALYLILNFATVAVLYLILNAPFIAMVHVSVYAGAIMVLFLFVIMILGSEQMQSPLQIESWQKNLAFSLAGALVLVLGYVLLGANATSFGLPAAAIDSSPAQIGVTLFANYLLPFEITSVLLLAAMIGVVVLKIKTQKKKGA